MSQGIDLELLQNSGIGDEALAKFKESLGYVVFFLHLVAAKTGEQGSPLSQFKIDTLGFSYNIGVLLERKDALGTESNPIVFTADVDALNVETISDTTIPLGELFSIENS